MKKKQSELSKHMSELGKKGGNATAQKHGPAYMSKLAKKSWKNRRIVKI